VPLLVCCPGKLVGVIGRQVGKSQYFAGLWIEHYYASALSMIILYGLFQGILGYPLKVRIDCQCDGLAIARRYMICLCPWNGSLLAVRLYAIHAVAPGKLCVAGFLDPILPGHPANTVLSHKSDNLRRKIAIGIVTHRSLGNS